MNQNFYIIQLGGPNLFLKSEIIDYSIIFSLVENYKDASMYSDKEANSIGIILSKEFIIIDVETHKRNLGYTSL